MSAYICHPANVDTLVAVAEDRTIEATAARIYPSATWDDIEEARNLVARYLVSMNVRSVQYRYGGENAETLPGYGFDAWTTGTTYYPMPTEDAYKHAPTRLARSYKSYDRLRRHGGPANRELAAVLRRILGVAKGYEYQTCELPEYRHSPAAEFVRDVVMQLVSGLMFGWTLDGDERVDSWERELTQEREEVSA